MILAVDVGNSNIVFGVYKGDEQILYARVKTDVLKTECEYAVLFDSILSLHGIASGELRGAAISSVVWSLTPTIVQAVKTLSDVPVLTVGPGVRTGLNIRIDDPSETGADLVCTAVGALKKYSMPAIVVDLGTATKLTVIDKNGNFIGGSIMPGVLVSLGALSSAAAQLPHIGLSERVRAIGTNTVDCMVSGSVLGTASMIDGMISRYRREIGDENATVIACGGLAEGIVEHCETKIVVDKCLLLDGLMAIWKKNNG